MKLYEWVLSANSRKVRAVAAELGLTLDRVPIQLWEGSHKKPEFLVKNPGAADGSGGSLDGAFHWAGFGQKASVARS